jgi:threonine dehydratase
VGAEPIAADDAFRSFESGIRQPAVENPATLADGLLTRIGALPFAILQALGADVITVSEESIAAAALFHLTRMKLLVEPSGATPLAALRAQPERFRERRVGLILSGGNTDLTWLPR